MARRCGRVWRRRGAIPLLLGAIFALGVAGPGPTPTEAAAQTAVAAPAPTPPSQLEYGAFLAKSCAPCHQVAEGYRSGNFAGAARIAGLEPALFLSKLAAKAEAGDPVMRQVAEDLGPAEREALAAYLSGVALE